MAFGCLALCSPASADEFWAAQSGDNSDPACPASDPCTLPTAVSRANAGAGNPQTVRVQGELTHTGAIFLAADVQLIGSGREAGGTKITATGAQVLNVGERGRAQSLRLEGSNVVIAAGAVLEDATVNTSGAASGDRGIGMGTGPQPTYPPTRLTRVTLEAAEPGQDGVRIGSVLGGGRAVIEHSSITADRDAVVMNTSSASPIPTTVTRSTLRANSHGLRGGTFATTDVSSSVIAARDPAVDAFRGVLAADGTYSFDQVTIDGRGSTGLSRGILLGGNSGYALRGSVVRNVAAPVTCAQAVTISHSNVQNLGGLEEGTDPADCAAIDDSIDADPRWVDPSAGNYRLLGGSPGIDTGHAPTPHPDASPTDRDNAPRATDGDNDGQAERDMGAFEYQPAAPSASASAAPASAAVGENVRFTGTATDPNAGDSLAYAWRFDDGATASGPAVDRAFSSPGAHTATLTVTDSSGRTATATATVNVSAPAATASGDTAGSGGLASGSAAIVEPLSPVAAISGRLGGASRFGLATALRRGVGPFTVTPARPDWRMTATLLAGRTVVGRVTKRGARAGQTSFSVKLNSRAKKRYRRAKSLGLTLRVAVTAPGGPSGTQDKKLTLRR